MTVSREKIEFDLKSLTENLKKCDDNIKIFEEAIIKEISTKSNLREIISTLEKDLTEASQKENLLLG